MVEVGGGWWRLVEVGGGWWRMVEVSFKHTFASERLT
jgi:hypothetical protein